MLPVTLSSNSSLHFRLLKQNIKVLDFFFPLEVRMGTCFTINLVDTNDSIFFFLENDSILNSEEAVQHGHLIQ